MSIEQKQELQKDVPVAIKLGVDYTIDPEHLPYSEDLERFAPPSTPEHYTEDEKRYLRPFFSNIDRRVFVAYALPEEVAGALSSRYSRSRESFRRMFLTEYIGPILYPERQKDWESLLPEEREEKLETRSTFLEFVVFLETHKGIENIFNIERARKFFKRWLAEFGDDSIAELGTVHICLEGVSNVVVKEVEDKRVGISPLEKSSRYVSFADRRHDGEYQYIIPGELRGTSFEEEYREVMDLLFETYAHLHEPYLDYIKGRYPRGDDETEGSFANSRSAKRFDDIRDLLPFSTQTNVALVGNGRAFEDLVNRLLYHPLGEARWWGQAILAELEKVVPSFVERPKTPRGAVVQKYRRNLIAVRDEMAERLFAGVLPERGNECWVRLLSYTPDADITILATSLFSRLQLPLSQVMELVRQMSVEERAEAIARILKERKFGNSDAPRQEVRFRKVLRAFENAHYLFEVWGRGGDYRDLHRHRQLTQERQRFTARWGYDLEKEVLESPFAQKVKLVLERAADFSRKLEKISLDLAQYSVPFSFIQHWYFNMAPREIYWMGELRTGSQGRPHYREICQQIAKLATLATPAVFQGLMADFNDYSLARRESEKRSEVRLKALEKLEKI